MTEHGAAQFACAFGADGTITRRSDWMDRILGAHTVVFDAVVADDRSRLLRAIADPNAANSQFDLRWKDPAGRVHVLASLVIRHVGPSGDGDETTGQIEWVAPHDPGEFPGEEPGQQYELYGADVTEVRRLSALLRAQREVLDQIATSAPIATALDAVARMIEATAPDTTVAVYLRRGEVIELAAAPSVPASFANTAASVIAPAGLPVPGTIEPVTGDLADAVTASGLGFGWWLTVIDEHGEDLGRVVVLSGDKRFLTADERHQCDEAARLISVAAGTARSVRRAFDAESRDPLTGLLNRRALLRAIEPSRVDAEGTISGAPAPSAMFALVVDVGGLRACNVELGFDAGDTLLLAVAERLRRIVRARDLLARWSGSRFLLVGHEPALSGRAGQASRRAGGLGGALEPDGAAATRALTERATEIAGARVMVCGRTIDPAVAATLIRPGPDETPAGMFRRLEARPPAPTSGDLPDVVGSGEARSGR